MTGHFFAHFSFQRWCRGHKPHFYPFILAPSVSYSADFFFFFCYLFHYGMTTRFHNCSWAESNPFMPRRRTLERSDVAVPPAGAEGRCQTGKVVLNVLWCCGGERWQTGLGAAPQPSVLCVPSSDKLNPTRLLEHGPTRYRLLGQLERC